MSVELKAHGRRVGVGLRLVVPTTVTNGAVTIGAALGGLIVARALGTQGRGEVAAIIAWFVVVQVVAEGGVQGATAFYAARTDTDRRALIRRTAGLLAGQAIVVAILTLALAWWLNLPPTFTAGFTVIVAGLVPVLWFSASLFALQGIRIGVWNLARITQPPIYIALLLTLWGNGRLTPITAVSAVLASNVFAGAVALLAARTLVSTPLPSQDEVSTARIYRFALPNLAWTLPTIITARLDQLSLSLLVSVETLGQYVIAVSLTSLTVPFVSSIGNVLMPLLSRRSSEDRPPDQIGRVAIVCAAAAALVVTTGLALAAPWLVPALFGPGFEDVPRLTWLLAPATVLYATKWVAADVLRGVGDPAAPARAEWAALVINAVTVPIAAVVYGGPGAALAQSVGFSVALVIMLRRLDPARPAAARTLP